MSFRRFRSVSAVLSAALLSACTAHHPAPSRGDATTGVQDPNRIHALLLNGGGRREINYQSHQHHLERLITLLETSGVRKENIAVFSADGEDPTADLATREMPTSPDFWILPASGAMRLLAPPTIYVDSTLPGFEVKPARKDDLQQWFVTQG